MNTPAGVPPYALNFSMDTDAPKIFATSGVYNESAWSFMTPPDETNLSALKQRGAKLIQNRPPGRRFHLETIARFIESRPRSPFSCRPLQ